MTVEYEAKTKQDTLYNPTNHVYFNLNRDNNVIDNHKIKSEQLNMYPIDRNNLIENTSSIDLLAILKQTVYLLVIFLTLIMNYLKSKLVQEMD